MCIYAIIGTALIAQAQRDSKKFLHGSQHKYHRLGYAGSITLDAGRNWFQYLQYNPTDFKLASDNSKAHSVDIAGSFKLPLFRRRNKGTENKLYISDYGELGLGLGNALTQGTNYGLVGTYQFSKDLILGADVALWGYNFAINVDAVSWGVRNILAPKVMAQYKNFYFGVRYKPSLFPRENNPNSPGVKQSNSRFGMEARFQPSMKVANKGIFVFVRYDQQGEGVTFANLNNKQSIQRDKTIRFGVTLMR
jgi:hypothetical protein